jgi:hypothetical protein
MNKTLFTVAAFALFGAVQPASAMMCGGGAQQAQATGNTVSTGMMCGATQAADDPMADKPAQPKAQQSGMCPCCRNMAMMRGGTGGSSTGSGMMHNMPGMEAPKQ